VAIQKERLSDQVLTELKKIITEKGFIPGQKFYSEQELVTMFDVSRSSVREAVRLLEVAGMVTVKQGKGVFIADPGQSEHQAFSEWLRDNETSLEEHFEMRLIIDPKAAGYAARKADDADIIRLEEICENFRLHAELGNIVDMIKLDEQFHLQLAKSTKNRTLFMIMKTMTESLPEGWISSLHVPGRIEKSVHEHHAIVEAIKLHNQSLAEKLMEDHLKTALEEIHLSMHESSHESAPESSPKPAPESSHESAPKPAPEKKDTPSD
jgi:GntR family transcriptional regulator, transcriptional repressor for pyruvate dehydrogenase complex